MSCVKVEAAVLGFPSQVSLMVSVDVNHHERRINVHRNLIRFVMDGERGRRGYNM